MPMVLLKHCHCPALSQDKVSVAIGCYWHMMNLLITHPFCFHDLTNVFFGDVTDRWIIQLLDDSLAAVYEGVLLDKLVDGLGYGFLLRCPSVLLGMNLRKELRLPLGLLN